MPHNDALVLLFAVVAAVTTIKYWRIALKFLGVGTLVLIAYGAYHIAELMR
jgi:hypothetical protein